MRAVPDVFISYSRKDGAFVSRLHRALTDRDRDVWVDWEDIPEGQRWRDELAAGLEQSRAFVFVVTPSSLASEECGIELARAVESGKRIVPVVLQDVDGLDVPDELASRNYVFFREGVDDFDASVERLERAIDTDHEWVRDHTRLLGRAAEWDRGGRDPSLLLRGADLRAAETDLSAWTEGKEPVPTGLQREYVAAGRRAAGRRATTLAAAAAAAVVVSLGLAVFALLERDRAVERERAAQARGLAAGAVIESEADPERAALLAVDSLRVDPSPQAEEALRRVVGRLQARGVLRTGRPVAALDLSARRQVVVAEPGGAVRLWDPEARRRRVLARHPGGATSATLSPDGRRVAASGNDGVGRVVDVDSGRTTVTVRAPRPLYTGISDDMRTLVGLDGQRAVRLWDARTGRLRRVLRGGGGVVNVGIDRRVRRVVTLGRDGRIESFDGATGRRLAGWRVPASEHTVNALTPDGSLAVAVSPEIREPEVRDTATGRVRHRLTGHRLGVLDVAISADGRRIATGSYDNTARLWDARTGRLVRILRGHGDSVTRVVFSRDGRRLATASPDESVRVWATRTGEALTVLRGHRGDVALLALSHDGARVATGGVDATVRMWEAAPGRTLALLRHRGPIEAATLDPTGRLVASSGPDRLQFAEAATGRVLASDRAAILSPDPTHDMAFDPRRRNWAIADGFAAYVFRLSDGRFWSLDHQGWVNAVEWDRRGARLATAADDGTARILDARAVEQARFPHPGRRVWRARFSPDGARLVTLTDDGAVHVWRVADRREVSTLPGTGRGSELALSPDGRTVAANDGQARVRVWRVGARPETARNLVHRGFVNAMRFLPDGRGLATAGDDGTVRVWDVRSGRQRALMRGHSDRVRDVDVSRDGRFLLTAGDDRNVILWDLRTRRVAATYAGHDGPVARARFSRDSRSILAVPETGAAAVYACDACLPVGALVRRARALAGRRLTEAERARYLG